MSNDQHGGIVVTAEEIKANTKTRDDGSQVVTIPDFNFKIVITANKLLHIPFMTFSDIHWGTAACRAKRLAQALENLSIDVLFLIGDIVDGERLGTKKKWKFPLWHQEGMAHILRFVAKGTKVTYIPGNHDIDVRKQTIWHGPANQKEEKLHHNLCGRTFLGMKVVEEAFFVDPQNRRIKLIHGDQYDDDLFGKNKEFWYHLGDAAYEILGTLDSAVHHVPGFGHLSIQAILKRATKKTIENCLGVLRVITDALDNKHHDTDIEIYGHSHMPSIRQTPGGKLLVNDGSCTEHVQGTGGDEDGQIANFEWHKDRIILITKEGQQRTFFWKDLGLSHFSEEPRRIEDESKKRVSQLERIMYRLWPPRERQTQREMRIRQPERIENLKRYWFPQEWYPPIKPYVPPSAGKIPLPNLAEEEREARRADCKSGTWKSPKIFSRSPKPPPPSLG